MIKGEIKHLRIEELLGFLASERWYLRGGREVKNINESENSRTRGFAIMDSTLNCDSATLRIVTIDDTSYCIYENDEILLHDWTIEVKRLYPTKQQRKKSEGGGWHEMPVLHIAFRMTQPERQASIIHYREERARILQEERKREAVVKAKAKEERQQARRQAFISGLRERFVGKTIGEINIDEDYLSLGFDDGSSMTIALDGGDLYDVWITVEGVSLRSFK